MQETPNITEIIFGGPAPSLDDPSENWFEASKLHRGLSAVEVPGVYMFETSPWLVRSTARAGKRYLHRPAVVLPPPDVDRAHTLADLLDRRRTPPGLVAGPGASMRDVSTWCWTADGISHRVSGHHLGRTAPSGGALFPRDLYIALNDTGTIGAGLYHYDPYDHLLRHLGDARPSDVGDATAQPDAFGQALAAVVLTGSFWRSRIKYGQRSLRFGLLEAGHVAQNLLLGVMTTGHAAQPIGGFFDDEIADLLGLDGLHDAPLYVLAIGHPAPSEEHEDDRKTTEEGEYS